MTIPVKYVSKHARCIAVNSIVIAWKHNICVNVEKRFTKDKREI